MWICLGQLKNTIICVACDNTAQPLHHNCWPYMYQKFQLKVWHDHMPLKRKFEIYPYSAQWGIRNIKISLSDWIARHDKDKWLTSLTWLYVVICLCTSQLLCVLSWLPLSFTRVLIILCFVSLISCTFIALQPTNKSRKPLLHTIT